MTARILAAVAVVVCVVATGLPCNGQERLPSELAWTACDAGFSGFNQISKAMIDADEKAFAGAWLMARAEALKKPAWV